MLLRACTYFGSRKCVVGFWFSAVPWVEGEAIARCRLRRRGNSGTGLSSTV